MQNSTYEEIRQEIISAAKVHKKPVLVHFELTGRCNLDCKMCYVHNQKNNAYLDKELTTAQWKQIFDQAYDNDMMYAILSGGECLLRKDFKELYLHLWNKHIFVTVLTNGILLNDDYIEFFKTYPPDLIQISLYGSNENGYLNVTGHRGFEKTITAISTLKASNLNVKVAVTASRYMKDDYIKILQLCKNKGFYTGSGDIMLMQNRDEPNKNDYFLTQDEIVSLSVQRAMLNREVIPVAHTPEPCRNNTEPPRKGLPCNAGNCLAAITWDGKMHVCLSSTMDGFSLLEMSYKEAWKKTVQTASEVIYGAECSGCPYDKTCPKCPFVRLKDLKSGLCNPEICELTRRLVSAGVKKLKPIE